jgi:hypothetical protein
MGIYFILLIWGTTITLIFAIVHLVRSGKGAVSGALAIVCIFLLFPFGFASVQTSYEMIKTLAEARSHPKQPPENAPGAHLEDKRAQHP